LGTGNPSPSPWDPLRHSRLFRSELGKFNDGVHMPIPFKDNVDLSDLRQPPFNLSRKDELTMDSILDPMKATGQLEDVPLGKPSPSASPAFLVWRNDKPRVVMDLRRVNTKLNLKRLTSTTARYDIGCFGRYSLV
jgi:hypothetical protein